MHGLMFHHFHDQIHPPGQGAISAAQLAEMIAFLGRDRILSASEWLDRACNSTLLPEHILPHLR